MVGPIDINRVGTNRKGRTGCDGNAAMQNGVSSHHGAVALDAGPQHLVHRARPPVGRRRFDFEDSRQSPAPRRRGAAEGCRSRRRPSCRDRAACPWSAPASRRRERRAAGPCRRARSAATRRSPTTRDRCRSQRRSRRCAPDRARRRYRAPAAVVFTQARSAAYIGCSGSIASGMPACLRIGQQARASASVTCACAARYPLMARCPAANIAAGRRPPAPDKASRAPRPRRWRGDCRRASPDRCAASAVNMPPRQ